MEDFITLISNFGFPIACCGVLMWYINKLQEQFQEQLKIIMQEHKEETNKMTEAINSNTLVMQKLVDKIGEV